MYLKAIEMQGFKSFPDKTVLQFGKGITAVVGPNGSGKSNLSDAMRWVLGEQSTKNLRGSKMEDVIFSGTSSRRAVGFAEVTLRLDNSDKTLHNDKKEVTVTRRYYRSGESEYKINSEPVRLKDIHELFMDTGLGRDGYSMISQGKVETLISGKSEERRDMLEEAAGISHFRYRRTDAVRRLDQAEENLLRLRDILTELETRVGPLKIQSEKAQKFLAYAGEKKNLEIGLWLYTIEKTKDELRDHEKNMLIADAQYEAVCDELNGIASAIDGAIEGAQRISVQIDEIRRASSQLEEQAAVLESQIAVQENNILHNNETIARIEREKTEESDTDSGIAKQIEDAKDAVKALFAEIAQKRVALEALSGELDNLGDMGYRTAEESRKLSEEISKLSLSVADDRVTVSTAASSVEEIENRLKAVTEAIENRAPILAELEKQKTEAQNAIDENAEKTQSLLNSLEGIELLFNKRQEKYQALTDERLRLENECARTESRVQMLSDLEKNMEGYQGSVKAVMREVKHGVLKGIHAPLSQLITVKEKYSLAVETALGAALQNIVTDTEEDAKKAIGYLKESRAGRATFLPLTAIRSRVLDEKGLDDAYGYINLASNLVEYDKKYTDIMQSLLGRIVVAEDLDCAVAIAKKYGYRFKVVTLDGQVVNAGGSMTGGAKFQGAGLLSRGNEIEKLHNAIKELKQKIETAEINCKAQQESLSAVTAEREGTKAELTSLGEDKIRLEGALALKAGQFDAVKAADDEGQKEADALNGRKAEILKNAESAKAELTKLQTQLEAAEAKMAAAAGDREALQKKREEMTVTASELKLSIATAEKEIEAKNESVSHLEDRSLTHRDRLSLLDAEIADLTAKNADLREIIDSLKENTSALRQQSENSKLSIADAVKSREQFEKTSGEQRILERAKTEEREKIAGEQARLHERRDTMSKEYEELTVKLLDEYELTVHEAQELDIELGDIKEAKKRLNELKSKIRSLGNVNVSAVEEYKEVSERYEFMRDQIGDIEKSKAELLKLIGELTERMGSQFSEQFQKINASFGGTFGELFGGGKAELVLSDPADVLECDIEIKVQPPGKNVQNLSLLSGGEKGLSAIALLFAILKVNPCPFCIFDEVEAALDDVNVVRYASYVRRMTENTQFILITHRRGTMEEADMLYGVTMQDKGVSKLLELKTAEMARQLGLE